MIRAQIILMLLAMPAVADTLVAAHTIRAKSILGPADIAMVTGTIPGALSDPHALIGTEARVTLYAGRPIRQVDVGPPAIIERNQIVTLTYARGVVSINTEGRAMQRAGVGDSVRAMNLASRTTISGVVTSDGRIRVEGGY